MPRYRTSRAILAVLALAMGGGAWAQSALPPPPRVQLNGFLSTSFSHNFNRPKTRTNQFRVFDQDDESFLLDVCELVVQRNPLEKGEAGFRVDLTAGSSIPRSTASAGLFRDASGKAQDIDIHQAFISYIVPWGRGIRLDLGKHVTHLGYEVIEGYDGANDQATRSFLFGYAIPFTHTGLRAGFPISNRLITAFYLVNGWDNVRDNNRAKSFGGQLGWTPSSRLALTANYLGGAEQDSSDSNLRHDFDLIGIFKLSGRLSLGLEAEYGMERDAPLPPAFTERKNVSWRGAALYTRAGLSSRFAICGRAEIFDDADGIRTSGTDRPERHLLKEITLTPELHPAPSFVLRGDLRCDFSGSRVFLKKDGRGAKAQPTVTINANFSF